MTGELRGGARHIYVVRLEADQFILIKTTQQGIDLVVELYGPGGERVARVDSPNGSRGMELLWWVTERPGLYRVELAPLEAEAPRGSYEVKLEERRAATSQDRKRVAAETALAEAELLRQPGTKEAWRATLEKVRPALPLFVELADRPKQARTLYLIGRSHYELDEAPPAAASLQQARTLYQNLSDRAGEAISLFYLARVSHNSGAKRRAAELNKEPLKSGDPALGYVSEIKRAVELYEQSLALFHEVRDTQGEVSVLNWLGDIYASIERGEFGKIEETPPATEAERALDKELAEAGVEGERKRAFKYYLRSLRLSEEAGDETGAAEALSSLGVIYQRAGKPPLSLEKARELFTRAREIFRRTKSPGKEARVLARLGGISEALKQPQRAVEEWEQALAYYRTAGQKGNAATLLNFLAPTYYSLKNYDKALACHQQEAALRRELKEPAQEAKALAGAGKARLLSGDGREALRLFAEARAIYRATGDRKGEAATFRDTGLAYFFLKDEERAREAFNHEFRLVKADDVAYLESIRKRAQLEIFDPELLEKQQTLLAATDLSSIEMVYDWLIYGPLERWGRDYPTLPEYVFKTAGNLTGLDAYLLGTVFKLQLELTIANEHLKALLKQNELLAGELKRRGLPVKERPGEEKPSEAERAKRLHSRGEWLAKRERLKAPEIFRQALEIRRALGDAQGTAETLHALGEVLFALNENQAALKCFEEARSLRQAAGDRAGEALALTALGSVHNWQGERQRALGLYEQALALYRGAENKRGETLALSRLGESYYLLGEKQKALENLRQALEISREPRYPDGDGRTLAMMGLVYASLNDAQKSQDFYRRAAAEFRRSLNKSLVDYNLAAKAQIYNQLGDALSVLGRAEEALLTYRQGLKLQRDFGSRSDEAYALNQLGLIYLKSAEPGAALQARESFQRALELRRADGNRGRVAEALHHLGTTYEKLGDRRRALSHYHQALALRRDVRDIEGEGETLNRLMLLWQAMGQPRLGIFYGKQAVNAFQRLRLNIQGLDRDLQKSYLASRQSTYRQLADLLIEGGRLPEAQQVIELLKREEFLEFIRRDVSGGDSASAMLTRREAESDRLLREKEARIGALSRQYGELLLKGETLSPAEKSVKERLEREIVAANEAFDRFLEDLPREFAKAGAGEKRSDELRKTQGLSSSALNTLGPGTVILSTVVTPERYHIILFTAETQKRYTVEISAAELNRKVSQFRSILDDPRLKFDPLPKAQELYRIIVAPVARELEEARAQTLMWSLDGALRYLPVGALHDGERYLVERYRLSVFTPVSDSRLEKPPSERWRALGLGVSKGSDPLPSVVDELYGIIRDDTKTRATGVLPGRIMLDEEFTKDSMRQALDLRNRYPIVHIASHFRFSPNGNEYDSYLLLGGGADPARAEDQRLTLAEVRRGPNIFRHVELLTLSACNTAVSESGTGSEVENFGVLAQMKGARAVIATLWRVDDASTMMLMKDFYRLRNESPAEPKIEALRRAQLSLLRGELVAPAAAVDQLAKRDAKPPALELDPEEETWPRFRRDPRAPYAHPYFWAPFILIGNWR